MKTLLVPVDFTATSKNTVNFAAKWSKQYEYNRIILLKTFYDSIFENIMVSAAYSNMNQDYMNSLRQDQTDQLQDLCKTLSEKVGAEIKVITAVSELPLLRSIFEIIKEEKPELVMLGTDNYSYSSSSFIGTNVIDIAKASPVRVLIVPADSTYKPVEHALLPYNLNMLKDLDRLNRLRNAPQWAHLKLLVLNIDTFQSTAAKPDKIKETEEKFDNFLKNFRHEVYYATDKDLLAAIRNFTKDHNVQLIIALPGQHSFLYNLTHKSISQAIYRNARLPVLILK